jgi:hypothetical protein
VKAWLDRRGTRKNDGNAFQGGKTLARRLTALGIALAAIPLVLAPSWAQQAKLIPSGAKVFLEPMGGFDTYLKDAMIKKKVPLQIVDEKAQAEFVNYWAF